MGMPNAVVVTTFRFPVRHMPGSLCARIGAQATVTVPDSTDCAEAVKRYCPTVWPVFETANPPKNVLPATFLE